MRSAEPSQQSRHGHASQLQPRDLRHELYELQRQREMISMLQEARRAQEHQQDNERVSHYFQYYSQSYPK